MSDNFVNDIGSWSSFKSTAKTQILCCQLSWCIGRVPLQALISHGVLWTLKKGKNIGGNVSNWWGKTYLPDNISFIACT